MTRLEGIELDNQIQRTIERWGRDEAVASFGIDHVMRIEREQEETIV